MITRSQIGIPTVVEGRKDVEALRRLKVQGKIICLKATADGFYDFAARLFDSREVTVLTDFDREGSRLAAKLVDELTHMRVKADITIWKKLKALCRPEIRTVEELADYIEKLREEAAAD
jgi:5S rRNA maturation endonuclease (ribonuclease M5)